MARPTAGRLLVGLFAIGLAIGSAGGAQAQIIRTFRGPPETVDFGMSLATIGQIIFVGDESAEPVPSAYGAVYMFDGVSGNLEHILTPPVGRGGNFGWAIAVGGQNVLVGAPAETIAGELTAGAAYLFDEQTGALRFILEDPSPHNDDSFGSAVAVSDDWAVVGVSFGDNGGAVRRGRVHIYDAHTGLLVRTLLNPSDGYAITFGTSVAVAGDRIVVSAPGAFVSGISFAGVVLVYDALTGSLLSTLERSADFTFKFGQTLATNGSQLLVGTSGTAYLFDLDRATLLSRFDDPAGGSRFASSLAFVGDDRVLVGAPGARGGGAAFLFEATSGRLLQTFRGPPTDITFASFGTAVAPLGSDVVVSDWGSRLVHILATCDSLGDGVACDDGDACTTGTTCSAGTCIGSPVQCPTPDQCHTFLGCDVIDGCITIPKPDGEICNTVSGIRCSEPDTCQNGTCQEGGFGDGDGDLVCGIDDNCPFITNPDQRDMDHDGDGDACDFSDGVLDIRRARVVYSRAGRPPSGRLTLRADFTLASDETGYDVSQGVVANTWDDQQTVALIGWTADQCRSLGLRAICKSADKSATLRITPHVARNGVPRTFSANLTAKKLSVAGLTGRFAASLTNKPGVVMEGIDRIGAPMACRTTATSATCSQ